MIENVGAKQVMLIFTAGTNVLAGKHLQYEKAPGQMLGDFANVGSDAFLGGVRKRRAKGVARLSPAGITELRKLYETEAPPILEKRARVLELEQKITAAVHDAYGLDANDLTTLRNTAPPRMPPGW